jgi:peptidyl serine alpha-galactosyltransferase
MSTTTTTIHASSWGKFETHKRMWLLASVLLLAVYQIVRSVSLFWTAPSEEEEVLDFWRPPMPEAALGSSDDSRPDYHIVFSTSCTEQQHWESYVFFYHCFRVQQPGSVTRIASGCSETEAAELQAFHEQFIAPMADPAMQQFALHLTPDYSRVRLSEGKYAYKYMNKPYGLRHWMEHKLQLHWTLKDKRIISPFLAENRTAEHAKLLDGVVILMDPDMVLLRPIGHDFSSDRELWAKKPKVTKVTHGNPISQQDGYLSNDWMNLNFSYITGDETIQPPPWSEGPLHWNTGPPYLATVSDMYQIASVWTETAPRVVDVLPHLFSEMYGFIIATVMLKLPFHMTQSIVVSTTSANNREGWPMIDSIPDQDICRIPVAATGGRPSPSVDLPLLPTGLHYCGIYLLEKSMFSKYRVKKNIMNCEKGLMTLPSMDVYPKYKYKIYPPRADLKDATSYTEVKKNIDSTMAKREAFMACGMISALNEALRFYKRQACGVNGRPPANFNETYTIHGDPTNY